MPPVWLAVLFVFGPPLGVFGVGHMLVAPVRLSVAFGWFPALSLSSLRGVGQFCVYTWRLVMAVRFAFEPSLSPIRCFIARCASGVLLSSFATGVGQDEEPFALVRGANFRRREEPFRDPVAKAFEVWANNVPVSKPKVSPHVFEEAPSWLALSDDSRDRRPEVAGVVDSEPLAGNGEGLAGITANDSRNAATPRSAIEGVEIRPYRRVIQPPFFHARCQEFGGRCFVFNAADDASSSERHVDAEVESPGSGAEGQN